MRSYNTMPHNRHNNSFEPTYVKFKKSCHAPSIIVMARFTIAGIERDSHFKFIRWLPWPVYSFCSFAESRYVPVSMWSPCLNICGRQLYTVLDVFTLESNALIAAWQSKSMKIFCLTTFLCTTIVTAVRIACYPSARTMLQWFGSLSDPVRRCLVDSVLAYYGVFFFYQKMCTLFKKKFNFLFVS